jgi:hypothetical protein
MAGPAGLCLPGRAGRRSPHGQGCPRPHQHVPFQASVCVLPLACDSRGSVMLHSTESSWCWFNAAGRRCESYHPPQGRTRAECRKLIDCNQAVCQVEELPVRAPSYAVACLSSCAPLSNLPAQKVISHSPVPHPWSLIPRLSCPCHQNLGFATHNPLPQTQDPSIMSA